MLHSQILECWASGNTKKAIEELEKDLNKYPFNGEYILSLGLLYLTIGEFEKAGNEFLKVLQINPNDETAREYLYLFGHNRKSYEIVRGNEFILISKNTDIAKDLITIKNSFKYINQLTELSPPPITIFQGFQKTFVAYPFGRPLHKVIHIPTSCSQEQLVHELAHIFIPHHFMVFNEGIALYIENILHFRQTWQIRQYKPQHLINLLKENVFSNMLFYKKSEESYAYSYYFVNHLIKQHGLKAILDFYVETQNILQYNLISQKFEEHFKESLSKSVKNLEQVFVGW